LAERTLLIRADASTAMGTGHVMRCLALAQAWQDRGGQCVFAMAESTPAVERRLRDEGMEVEKFRVCAGSNEDAKQALFIAGKRDAAWIVADGYHFGAEYQAAIKAAGLKLLLMDDNVHAERYSADLVLNHNLHSSESLYGRREPYTRLLLGPRYAMLRREFRSWRKWRREIPANGRKILVTMGGSDPDNVTIKVIEAIQRLANANLETVVLLGSSNPHLRPVKAAIGKQPQSMRVVCDATNVAEWMAWADVAVAGAGTTFWEMCFLGLPGILLVLAENQQRVAEAAHEMGIAWSLGAGKDASAPAIGSKLAEFLATHEQRRSQSDKGRTVVDGFGAERVVTFLSDLELRRAVASDCEVFWEWANDPEARAASFRNHAISWEGHKAWFQDKLADPKAVLYTAANGGGAPVGHVRYQIEGKRAVLSINLDARFRGCGWGGKMLAAATERFFRESEVEVIDAYVKPANQASMKLFAGASFLRLATEVIEGQEGIHFVLKKCVTA
jgi:UDP-2,4-diacetamido-2,4,6-trideoxy-beta-L-altropyranose hydrolase